MDKNNYYQKLDIIRIISCISVLLYHLNYLKGGFLAVCIFFTLSGYLSCISSLQKDNFSIIKYYKNRIKKIYLPLLITVFITIATISFFQNINWINLKPETNSILLGYNNFWQLNANLDYFQRHIESPFMHMWYIAILLQFELLFPILFIILKKIGTTTKKTIPSIITLIIAIVSYIYFYKELTSGHIMIAYYNTIARLFSCFLGISFGFLSFYKEPTISQKITQIKLNKIVWLIYILITIILIITINVKTTYLEVYMLLITLITIRLIDYSTLEKNNINSIIDKIIKSLSNITYEIYLIQYPIIFIFQTLNLNNNIKIPCIIILTIISSYILHISLNIKNQKRKIIRILLCILLSIISFYGGFKYIIAKDYTKEMKDLERKIEKNKIITKQKQIEYQNKMKEEQEKWQSELNEFTTKEEELKTKIKNLPVIGIGDSVMLGAANALYEMFPNGYFDGKVNRTTWEANDLLVDLNNRNLLGEIIIINLGTNGECSDSCKKELMNTIGNHQVFWVNATNPDYDTFNPNLNKMAEQYPNIHIVDWVSVASKHPEYLVPDKVHVSEIGAKAYSETIYNTIYNYYLEKLNITKNEKIKEHEEIIKNKILFIGNDLLLNVHEYIEDDYSSSEFIIDSKLTFNNIKKIIEEKSSINKIILILDNNLLLKEEELQTIKELSKNRNIIIITTSNISLSNYPNINIISIKEELKKHKEYLSPDKVHLTNEGNIYLASIIKKQ